MSDLETELKTNVCNAKSYIFDGMTIRAFCFKVIDGDTIKCVIKFKDEYLKIIVRLDNIDTPEKKSHKLLAERATAFTKRCAENKMVTLTFKSIDKYGRHLCKVFLNGQKTISPTVTTLNDDLVSGGYANVYDGGKKTDFENTNDETA